MSLFAVRDDDTSFYTSIHYWAFRDSEKTAQLLKYCINEAKRQNMQFATVSEYTSGINK